MSAGVEPIFEPVKSSILLREAACHRVLRQHLHGWDGRLPCAVAAGGDACMEMATGEKPAVCALSTTGAGGVRTSARFAARATRRLRVAPHFRRRDGRVSFPISVARRRARSSCSSLMSARAALAAAARRSLDRRRWASWKRPPSHQPDSAMITPDRFHCYAVSDAWRALLRGA